MTRRLPVSPVLALLSVLLVAATCSRSDRGAAPEGERSAGEIAERSAGDIAGSAACGPARVVLGVNDQGEADVDLARRAGLSWVRVTIPWRAVNPARGEWRWESADALVEPHAQAGHRVLAILSTAPAWAGSNANGTRPPEDVALWQEYVARVAERYRGKVEAYEVWNEPDRGDEGVGVGWASKARESPTYPEYVRAAVLAVREQAPGARIVAPALGSDPRAATAALLRRLEQPTLPEGSAAGLVDVVSIHANARSDEGSEEVWRRLRRHLRTLVERNPTLHDRPVWITEIGWPSDTVGEEGQGEKIGNLVRRIGGDWAGIDHPAYCGPDREEVVVFLYKEKDSHDESRGIHREDGTPKPVVEALPNLSPEVPGT